MEEEIRKQYEILIKKAETLFKEIKQVNEKIMQLQDNNGDPKEIEILEQQLAEIEILEQQLADLEIEVDEYNSMEKKK